MNVKFIRRSRKLYAKSKRINESVLLESRASKSRSQTEDIIVNMFKRKCGDDLFQPVTDNDGIPILTAKGDYQTLLQYLERCVRSEFFHNDYANIKFEPGIARIAYGELGLQANEDRKSLNKLKNILKVISLSHDTEFDATLDGMSFSELDDMFGDEVSAMKRNEHNRINNTEYNSGTTYNIVKINSFKEAKTYLKYTNPNSPWCVSNAKGMFDSYTSKGKNTIYFAYKDGFENLKPVKGRNAPLDEYGLSMLCIIIAPDYGDGPSLAYCACRWNHDNGGTDNVMNAEELSRVLGGNVFQLCPSNNAEIIIDGDLGLPSGTIWMTKNVGARTETDSGKYFAFNTPIGYYSNETDMYKFTEEWYGEQRKVKWSDNFKFEDGSVAPTLKDINELIDNCTYNFVTYNGAKGALFTSKKNGNSIFIPAGGCATFDVDGIGIFGGVGCCNASNAGERAVLTFSAKCGITSDPLCFGYPVRGIMHRSNRGKITDRLHESYSNNNIDYDRVNSIYFTVSSTYDQEELDDLIADEDFANDKERADYIEDYKKENIWFDCEFFDTNGEHLGYAQENLDMLDYEIPDDLCEMIIEAYQKNPQYGKTYKIEDILCNKWEDAEPEEAAKHLFYTADEYAKGMHGFILQDGTIILMRPGSDHNEITSINSIKSKWVFVERGNVSILNNNVRIAKELSYEQERILRKLVASYDEVYVDFIDEDGREHTGCFYDASPSYFCNVFDRYYREGILPDELLR